MTPWHLVPDALSGEDCQRLVALCTDAPRREAALVSGKTAPDIRRASLVWLDDVPATAWAMDRMTTAIAAANRERFGYDLREFGESAQVAAYAASEQAHFDWHSDIGAGHWAAQRKLTAVVQLSAPEEYEGGLLEVWAGHAPDAAPLLQGGAVVFPAQMLHRVTPVTRGTRWSLTLWAHGPAFR